MTPSPRWILWIVTAVTSTGTIQRCCAQVDPATAPAFAAPRVFESPIRPSAAGVGDFNNDRIPDLAVGGPGGLAIFLGDQRAGFQTPTELEPGADIKSILSGDFDGNGASDLAIASTTPSLNSGILTVLLGHGNGTFHSSGTWTVAGRPLAMTSGDFNGDGRTDLAVGGYDSGTVSLLLGAGDGTFAPPTESKINPGTQGLAAADFNSDGKLDLAAAGASGALVVLLGDGTGAFQPAVSHEVVSGPHEAIVTGDFDHDSRADLALGGWGSLVILRGLGNGSFHPPVSYSLGGRISSITGMDANHDGHTDLICVTPQLHTVSVALGKADGTFAMAGNYNVGSSPTSVAAADFDRDGHFDLAVTDSGSLGPWYPDRAVAILSGRGDGTVVSFPSHAVGRSLIALAAGDLNGDGASDLAAMMSDGIHLLWNQGGGSFRPAVGFFSLPATATAAADLNGDGVSDLAVANPGISAWISKLDGTFQPVGGSPAGTNVRDLETGDFNGDGMLDLAVVGSETPAILLLLNRGDGFFADPVSFPATSGPTSVALADFNGDGFLDAAVSGAGAVAVLLGNGNGTLRVPSLLPLEGQLSSVAAGDVSSDGIPDLAVTSADASGGWARILLGHGDGTFSTATPYRASRNPGCVALADFNQDDHPDLATYSYETGSVSLLPGRGDGTFGPSIQFFAGSNLSHYDPFGPQLMIQGDWDGDGMPDLAVGNIDLERVSILFNTTQPAVPRLQVESSPAGIVLVWPAGAGQWTLESSNDPGRNEWQPVPETPGTHDGQATLSLPWGQSSRFFRLRAE